MIKVGWKSFNAPEYKSNAPGEGVPSISEGSLDNGGIGEDLNKTVEDIFNADREAEVDPNQAFGLTIGSPPKLGVTVDPFTGEMVQDPSKTPYYIPSLDEFLNNSKAAGFEMTLSQWDDLKNLYNSAIADLTKEKEIITEKIENGEMIYGGPSYARELIKYINRSLNVAREAVEKIPKYYEEARQTYINEYEEFKKKASAHAKEFNEGDAAVRSNIIQTYLATADINGDGWVGEPEKGIRIINDLEFTDKTRGSALYNPDTKDYVWKLAEDGTPVTKKWFDPSRVWTVANKGVTLVTSEAKAKYTESYVFQVSGANNYEIGNALEAKIALDVPDFITVQADADGKAIVRKDKTDGTYLIPAELTQDSKGIQQKTPSDLENFIQMRVDKVIVESDKSSKGEGGYDQIVRFEAATGEVLAEIRIIGRSDSDRASNYGFALDGKNRTEPVSVDATGMISTFKHGFSPTTLDAIKKKYGIKEKPIESFGPSKSGADPVTGFTETINKFMGDSLVVEEDSEDATGLMVSGLSGVIKGSSHGNNLVLFGDPSKTQSLAPREGKNEEDNPLSRNIFYGNGVTESRNAVFSKDGGDFYATNVTLAWRVSTSRDAVSSVSMKVHLGVEESDPNKPTPDVFTDDKYIPAHTFAYLGGINSDKKYVNNPSLTTKKIENGLSVEYHVTGYSYYNTEKEGSYTGPSVTDSLVGGNRDADTSKGADKELGIYPEGNLSTLEEDFETALAELDNVEDDPYPDPTPENLGGDYYNQTYQEMADAFDELAQGLNINNNNWLDPDGDEDKDEE